MNTLIILIAIISASLCEYSKNCVSQHSAAYNENINNLNSLYQAQTFSVGSDPCEKMNNDNYRKLLKNKGFDIEGYNIDHIINKDLAGEHTNIVGNYIAANSSWQNPGVNRLCCNNSVAEKEEVYGLIYNYAFDNVYMCSDYNNEVFDDMERCSVKKTGVNAGDIILDILAVLFCIGVLAFIAYSLYNEHRFSSVENV
jgi:hypothetical protein